MAGDTARSFSTVRPALRRLAAKAILGVLFCVVLAALWELMAREQHNPLLPPVEDIASELSAMTLDGEAARQIGITLSRMSGGLAFGFVGAVVLALAAVRQSWFESFIDPGLIIGLTVPGLVWALLCVVWFGVSPLTSVVAVALGIAPALTINLIQGIRAVDPDLIEMAHVYKFSRLALLRYVWLPAVTPFLLSNARLGFSLAWKVIVLVEIFGLSNGIGYRLNSAFAATDVAGMMAWTIAFCVVMAVIEYGLIQQCERWLLRWRRDAAV